MVLFSNLLKFSGIYYSFPRKLRKIKMFYEIILISTIYSIMPEPNSILYISQK